ncbi:MAG: 30S ribosomal protein S20 [Desulfohalobiaceae bacterium]
MANHRSAIKRHKQSLKARERNRMVKTRIKNKLKEVRQAVEAGEKDEAQARLKQATAVLDKAAAKGVIHSRNASRRISRLATAVNSIE